MKNCIKKQYLKMILFFGKCSLPELSWHKGNITMIQSAKNQSALYEYTHSYPSRYTLRPRNPSVTDGSFKSSSSASFLCSLHAQKWHIMDSPTLSVAQILSSCISLCFEGMLSKIYPMFYQDLFSTFFYFLFSMTAVSAPVIRKRRVCEKKYIYLIMSDVTENR